MPYVSVGESRIYFERHGAGRDLVLLHGVGGNHASWFPQIAGLGDQFRLTTVDARGFGNSSDTEALGRDGFVSDLDQIWRTLELQDAVLLGQSMGGACAVSFTCRYPYKVKALVLADTLVGIALPDPIQKLMDTVELETAGLSQVERVLGKTTRARSAERTALYAQIASFNNVGLKTLVGTQQKHTIDEIAGTQVPILFVVGEEDVLFPPEIMRLVQRQLPNSQLAEIGAAGHSAHFETPEKFNRAVSDWYRSIAVAS